MDNEKLLVTVTQPGVTKNKDIKENSDSKVKEMRDSFDKKLKEVNQGWENRFAAREQEVAAQIKMLQDSLEKTGQVVQEKDHLMASINNEKKALEVKILKDLAKLKMKEHEIIQSEEGWKTKTKALEDQLKCELAAKEEVFEKAREESSKVSQLEEELRLLKQQKDVEADSNNVQEPVESSTIENVRKHWFAEFKRVNAAAVVKNKQLRESCASKVKEMKDSFDNKLKEVNQDWENRFAAREEEVATELKTLQEGWEKRLSQVILEKDDLIAKTQNEKKALESEILESSAKLQEKEQEIIQSGEGWKTKTEALEDQLRCELAAKKESLEKAREESIRVSQLEEELKLRHQQNNDLQVSHTSFLF